MRSAASHALAVAVACAVLGCAGDDDADTGPAMTTASDLSATLQRSTLFETRRALLLTVRNGGDEDAEVDTIQLSSPLFEPVPPETRDARVRAGGRGVAMPLPFGAAVCDDVADAPAELVTDVDGDEVRVALDEVPSGVLDDLHAAECAAAAVLADIDLRLGDTWTRTGPRTVAGEVELVQRHPRVTATVDEVLGNVIFTVGTETNSTLAVSDDQPSADAGVVITAARCDAHALIEYKRTFIFEGWVTIGGREAVRVDIEAAGTARAALEEALTECIG